MKKAHLLFSGILNLLLPLFMGLNVTFSAVWHAAAGEPNALNYNDFNQPGLYQPDLYRFSDHDPVIVDLHLGMVKVCLPVIAAL